MRILIEADAVFTVSWALRPGAAELIALAGGALAITQGVSWTEELIGQFDVGVTSSPYLAAYAGALIETFHVGPFNLAAVDAAQMDTLPDLTAYLRRRNSVVTAPVTAFCPARAVGLIREALV